MTEAKDWYSPGEIRFDRYQVIWIIEHLESLSAGSWPPDFKVTGYTGKKKGGFPAHAYFENPVVIAAEVKRRLKLTKVDGKLLKAQIQGGITEYEELEPEAQMALNYLSIFDFRKRQPYTLWKRDKAKYYRNKKRMSIANETPRPRKSKRI